MISKHTLVLTLGSFAGCATPASPAGDPKPPPTVVAPADGATAAPPSPAVAHVDDNIARLQALSVFEVGRLIIDAPEGAYNCYGPCPQFAGAIAAAREKSAARLERLVAAATAATADPSPATCEQAAIDRNIAALQALKIVDVGGLLVETPNNSPQCYSQPCPQDIAAAKAKTCERAGKLAGIAAAARDL